MPNTDASEQDSRRDVNLVTFFAKAIMAGVVMGGAFIAGAESQRRTTPDPQEVQKVLGSILKDPEKTDKLIKDIRNKQEIGNELVNDPRVRRNLRKLADVIMENSTRDQAEKKRWTKWTEKAAEWRNDSIFENRDDSITEDLIRNKMGAEGRRGKPFFNY
ncbi:MAG: hypothetical protein ACRELG_12955 [Gemmataceae bacterium]